MEEFFLVENNKKDMIEFAKNIITLYGDEVNE
jgi:hypothetical protein